MAAIDVNTKFAGLLGNPLAHSFSPVMHNMAFDLMGLNFLYLPIQRNSENFRDTVERQELLQ